MNNDEFEEIFESMTSKARNLLVEKAKEYATDGDRLHNFTAAGAAQGITPAQALRGMTTKHTIAINDMVWSGKDYPMSQWEEKIGDEFNYLILLMAVIWEEQNKTHDAAEQGDNEDGMTKGLRLGFSREQIITARVMGFKSLGYFKDGGKPVLFSGIGSHIGKIAILTADDFDVVETVSSSSIAYHGEEI